MLNFLRQIGEVLATFELHIILESILSGTTFERLAIHSSASGHLFSYIHYHSWVEHGGGTFSF